MSLNSLMRYAIRADLHPAFEPLRSVYCSLFEREWDIGSSMTVFWKGKKVANVVGGFKDPERRHYMEDTLQAVGSTSKVVESLCMAMLVERGHITYDTPIAKVWPEFGKSGKGHITLRQLMSHRAGLAYWPDKLDRSYFENKKKLGKFLGDLTLNWAVPFDSPGSAPQAYHTFSRGFLSSEICHRVDPKGRYLSQFLQEEICQPLGIEIYFGQPQNIRDRVSPTHYFPPEIIGLLMGRDDIELPSDVPRPDPKDPFYQLDERDKNFLINHNLVHTSAAHRSIMNDEKIDLFSMDQKELHETLKEVEFASSNAVTNAYSLAAIASVCANKGVFLPSSASSLSASSSSLYSTPSSEPVTLLSPSTIKKMTTKYDEYEVDKVIGTTIPFTHGGFASFNNSHITNNDSNNKNLPECYGWGGAGGVSVRFFPELNLAFAYVTNKMGLKLSFNDPRPNILLTATLECVKQAQNKGIAP